MSYLIIFFILVVVLNLYFLLSPTLRVVDVPNRRSSHKETTIRGAGIIFLFSTALTYFWFEGISLTVLIFIGILSVLSFIDDVKGLSAKTRLPFQIGAVLALLLSILTNVEWYWIILSTIVATGFLNIYNFMDGINGITTIYSTVFIGTSLYINQHIGFSDSDFLIVTLIGLLVFGYYNVRSKAKCFLGDVGSVTLGITVIIILIQLLLNSGNISFLLLVAIYVVDGGMTIITRLLRKENIFEAHRSHLYQLLANEGRKSHIMISIVYGGIQLILNLMVLVNFSGQIINPVLLLIMGYSAITALYLVIRKKMKRNWG